MSHRRISPKIPGNKRNDLCPCGSGKKRKKCHPLTSSKGGKGTPKIRVSVAEMNDIRRTYFENKEAGMRI